MTGKNIPINTTVLMEYVINNLKMYHEYVNSTGDEPDFNPYNSPIVYRTDDGKSVEIPEEVKKEAIKVWNNKNNSINEHTNNEINNQNNEFEELEETPTQQNINKPIKQYTESKYIKKPKEKIIYVEKKSNNIILYLIILVVLIAIGYYFYKNKK